MKLSRKKAIQLCIELWEWLTKTGKEKDEWPEREKYGDIASDCWFCEYDVRQTRKRTPRINPDCSYCPLHIAIGHCAGTSYKDWRDAETQHNRKKYAKLFLEQIKTLS